MLKRLKKTWSKKLMSYVGDIQSKSTNEMSSKGVMEKITTGEVRCAFDRRFGETPVREWTSKQLNGWLNHVLPFGTRNTFMGALPIIDVTDGESLSEARFNDFIGVIDEVNETVELKRHVVLQLVIEFGYLKELYENDGYYDVQFGFCLQKLIGIWPVMEYTMLKQGVRIGMKTKAKVKLEEEDYLRYTTTLAGYVYNYLNKDKVKGIIKTHILSKFYSKYKRKNRPGSLEVSKQYVLFHIKVILIDQIGSADPNMTTEDRVLQKKTKRFFSPIISMIPFLKPEFGIFHVGLELDSDKQYVEWTTSSSVFFKELDTVDPVLTVDLKPKKLYRKEVEQFSEKLASCIHKWNSSKVYNIINTNCQHFVVDLCKRAGVKVETPKGAFKHFFDKMKKRGIAETTFEPSDVFKGKYKLKKKAYEFTNHRELDEFCNKLLETAGDNAKKLQVTPEWKLLASFDEMFWIRYFNEKCLEKGEETMSSQKSFDGNLKVEDMICPFLKGCDRESDFYQKIVKKSKEYNKQYQEKWYNTYLEESIESDFQKSFKCDLSDMKKAGGKKYGRTDMDSDDSD